MKSYQDFENYKWTYHLHICTKVRPNTQHAQCVEEFA